MTTDNIKFPENIDLTLFLVSSKWSFDLTVVLLAYFCTKEKVNGNPDYSDKLYEYYVDRFRDIFKSDFAEPDFPARSYCYSTHEYEVDQYGNEHVCLDFDESMISKEKFIPWAKNRDIPIPDEFIEKLKQSLKKEQPDGSSPENEKALTNADKTVPNLDQNDRKKLGELIREKEKWDLSIEAAIESVFICEKHSGPITRDELGDKLNAAGFNRFTSRELPNSSLEKIWSALPNSYKQPPGRPKKSR